MRTAALALAILALTAGAARAEDRIGYCNVSRVLAESEAGKAGTKELDALGAALVQGVQAADAEAAKAETTKAPAATIKAKRDRAAALRQQYQPDMQARSGQLVEALKVRLAKVVAKLAVEKKLANVFDGAPIFARFDLTDDAIKRLNAEGPVAANDENDKLKAENARLRDQLAKAGKPVAADKSAAIPNLNPRAMTATRPTP